MSKVTRTVIAALAASLTLSGCARNVANPNIQTSRPSDSTASCAVLSAELDIAQQQHNQAISNGRWQVARNAGVGVLAVGTMGLSLFAMDTGSGYSTDEDNAAARIRLLKAYMLDKGCQ